MKIRDRIKELRRVKASELLPNPKNWRTHPEAQQNAMRGILAEVGIADAVLARETPAGLMLIDGHLRAEIDGDTEWPVLVLDVDEVEADLILATHDPLAAMAEADAATLDALLREVNTSSEELQEMLAELAEDAGLYQEDEPTEITEDEVPEPPAEPVTKTGDLWLLGEHRLLCGDSTNAEDVARLMNGEKADLCFTSPPYAQQRDYMKEGKEKCKDWDGLMQGVFKNLPMSDAGQVLVNLGLIHRDGEWIPYWECWIEWMSSNGWRRFGWYVWDKGFSARDEGGRLSTSHEFIWHFNKKTVRPNKWIPCETAGEVSLMQKKFSDAKGQYRDKSNTHVRNSHRIAESVVRVNRGASRVDNHPAAFPVQLVDYFLKSWPGSVYEPFAGSGTTLIAAEQLGRVCFAMEISPAYCDVVVKRWEKLTGKKATLAK